MHDTNKDYHKISIFIFIRNLFLQNIITQQIFELDYHREVILPKKMVLCYYNE